MAEYQSYPPGVTCSDLQVGDIVLCHRPGLVSASIRLGQKIRYRKHPEYAFWSHVCLAVGSASVIEALTKQVTRSPIGKYKDIEFTVIRTNTSLEDQKQILFFAKQINGEKYGFVTIASVAMSEAPGWHFTFGVNGHVICSGLVARGRERAGEWFVNPADVMPADIAWKNQVLPPANKDKGAVKSLRRE